MKRLAALLLVAVSLTACGDDGPSCEERGGHTVQDPPVYVKSGNVYIPLDRSHCEFPAAKQATEVPK